MRNIQINDWNYENTFHIYYVDFLNHIMPHGMILYEQFMYNNNNKYICFPSLKRFQLQELVTIFLILSMASWGSSYEPCPAPASDSASVNVIQFGAIGDGKTDDSNVKILYP